MPESEPSAATSVITGSKISLTAVAKKELERGSLLLPVVLLFEVELPEEVELAVLEEDELLVVESLVVFVLELVLELLVELFVLLLVFVVVLPVSVVVGFLVIML